MAVLEIKLKEASDNGGSIHLLGQVWGRSALITRTDMVGVTRYYYNRQLVKKFDVSMPTGTDIKAYIRQRAQNFYDGLTAQQKLQITGVCAEQL